MTSDLPLRPVLHPLWRALFYFLAFLAAQVSVAIGLMAVGYAAVLAKPGARGLTAEQAGQQVMDFVRTPGALTGSTVAAAVIVLALTFGFRFLLDRRPFHTLGFQGVPGWTRQLAAGVALGLLFNGVMAGVLVMTGNLKIGGISPDFSAAGLAMGVALFASVSLLEETAVRGYFLQVLEEWRGIRWAVVVSSVVFGVFRVGNLFIREDEATGTMLLGPISDPGQAAAGLLVILAAGLLLAYCYVVTRQLWLPIGLHFGWNFGMGSLLGFPVSNVPIPFPTLLKVEPTGPDLLTGGAFGLEGSALAVPAIVLLALCVRGLAGWMRAPQTAHGAAVPT